MKLPDSAVLMLLLTGLVCGCKRDQDRARRRSPVARDTAAASSLISEPQAVQILKSVDRARLISAIALSLKSENRAILEYARVVRADHGAISAALDSAMAAARLRPANHPLGEQLQMAAQQFASDIAARDTGVNNSYLAKEIADHERALQLLVAFIPHSKTKQVRATLEQMVPAYQAHLQRAREIMAERQAAAASRPRVTPSPVAPTADTAQRPPTTTTTTTTNM